MPTLGADNTDSGSRRAAAAAVAIPTAHTLSQWKDAREAHGPPQCLNDSYRATACCSCPRPRTVGCFHAGIPPPPRAKAEAG